MKITVLIPTWNCEKYILRAIRSVTENGWTDYEIRIMDNLSTDKTRQLVGSLKDSRIIFTSQKDRGMYEALNRGIHTARGEIIGWLGADDRLAKGSLEKIAQIFSHEDVNWCVGEGTFVFEHEKNRLVRHYLPRIITIKTIVRGNPLMSPSVYFRKSFFETIGGFDQLYKLAADYDLWIKFAQHENPYVCHETLSFFSYNGANASSTRKVEMYRETLKILRNLKQTDLRGPKTINTLRLYTYIVGHKIRGYF